MARERVNEVDLQSQLRAHGLPDLAAVGEAHVEPSGQLSVTRRPQARPADRGDEERLRAVLG